MTFKTHISLSAPELARLIEALDLPPTCRTSSKKQRPVAEIVQQGWADIDLFEDLILDQDSRIGKTAFACAQKLAERLKINLSLVGFKPSTEDQDFTGCVGVSIACAACILMFLERLGFKTDPTALCEAVVQQIDGQSFVSEEEAAALWYIKKRHKMEPVSVGTEPLVHPIGTVKTFVTASGYSVKVTYGNCGNPAILEVNAPNYVEGPVREGRTCPDCGFHYVSGYKLDEHEHRIVHRKWVSTLNPQPSSAVRKAQRENSEFVWVTEQSPSWQRIAVHRRALAFKREMRYDFTQWDTESDKDATGFLFVDDDYRIVGACCFRTAQVDNSSRERLDWIWIAPSERRKGWLTRSWQRFASRFGEFDIEHPISDEMRCFLIKIGKSHLVY